MLSRTVIGQWIREARTSDGRESPQTTTPNYAEIPPEVQLASEDKAIQDAYSVTCDILAMANEELRESQIEFYVFVIPSIFQVRNLSLT